MFNFYKKHNNKLYNKLVELSRNKFFYRETELPDTFESRILLIFFHLGIIFNSKKKGATNKKNNQEIFDSIFINIENHIRELGYGDVAVNKKMKDLNKIFYDILLKINKSDKTLKINKDLIVKYFPELNNSFNEKYELFEDYLIKFYHFCFELGPETMIKDAIKFKV